ncbi:MAG: hypothetical protein AB4080_17275 [Trichodesmium sp.]
MNREQVLLDKWRTLPVEKQQEVLDLVEQFYRQNLDIDREGIYQPKTEMGKKLWQIRSQALAKQPKLLTWDEIEAEISDRRGERE